MKIIAVDAMGGDCGCDVTIPASLVLLKSHIDLHIILVGPKDFIVEKIKHFGAEHQKRLSVVHASQVIAMDEKPAKALRKKKDSSLRVALELVEKKKAQACVSAGNTGALMAIARYVLKTLPGVKRPAIMAAFPTTAKNRFTRVLDLGANVDSDANQLEQFAIMGSVVTEVVDKIHKPRIAVLNVGIEAMKGNEQVKSLDRKLFSNKQLNYVGFLESDAIFKNQADVIVCDGFVGNSVLKAIEGTALLVKNAIKKAIFQNPWTRFLGFITTPLFRQVSKSCDPKRYNGATLLGLRGIVVKSHGKANVEAFAQALEHAVLAIQRDVPSLIACQLENLLMRSKEQELKNKKVIIN